MTIYRLETWVGNVIRLNTGSCASPSFELNNESDGRRPDKLDQELGATAKSPNWGDSEIFLIGATARSSSVERRCTGTTIKDIALLRVVDEVTNVIESYWRSDVLYVVDVVNDLLSKGVVESIQ